MSFMLTTVPARTKTKTVTRRLGWWNLKPGDRVQQVVKGMGLKKGEKVERIHVIEIVSTRAEPLDRLTSEPLYGVQEVIREGFPELTPHQFVSMFCHHNACSPSTPVNRIEFNYL
jgi:hypothetical protein